MGKGFLVFFSLQKRAAQCGGTETWQQLAETARGTKQQQASSEKWFSKTDHGAA
jgi:hypothetical protein